VLASDQEVDGCHAAATAVGRNAGAGTEREDSLHVPAVLRRDLERRSAGKRLVGPKGIVSRANLISARCPEVSTPLTIALG
jgi:hypothetical protein